MATAKAAPSRSVIRAGEADMENIGLDEYLGRADGVTAVEWPEAAGGLGASGGVKIEFALAGGDSRVITAAAGTDGAARLEKIKALWLKK